MFKEINVHELKLNPLDLFGKDWMALSSGNKDEYNAMTIAWGEIGSIWGKVDSKIPHDPYPVITVFVRPSRHTKTIMDKNDRFACSSLPSELKKCLAYLGSCSGKDHPNKIQEAGLTPTFSDGTIYFEEASMVFIAEKIYESDLKESSFLDARIIDRNYPLKDFHHVYVGKIIKILAKE